MANVRTIIPRGVAEAQALKAENKALRDENKELRAFLAHPTIAAAIAAASGQPAPQQAQQSPLQAGIVATPLTGNPLPALAPGPIEGGVMHLGQPFGLPSIPTARERLMQGGAITNSDGSTVKLMTRDEASWIARTSQQNGRQARAAGGGQQVPGGVVHTNPDGSTVRMMAQAPIRVNAGNPQAGRLANPPQYAPPQLVPAPPPGAIPVAGYWQQPQQAYPMPAAPPQLAIAPTPAQQALAAGGEIELEIGTAGQRPQPSQGRSRELAFLE